MSAHDYMSRSGYGEDTYPDQVYKFPVGAEGKPRPINGHIIGTRTYVLESYVEEISRHRAVYPASATKGFPSKGGEPFNSYGRPPEVHDLLSRILTEVNCKGPPPRTSDPNPGTNWGGCTFPPEPPASTSGPNLGRVQHSFPGKVERVDVYEDDHRYGNSPVKVEGSVDNYGADHGYLSSLAKVHPTRGYGYDYSHGSSPVKSGRAPDHQWGRSSSPVCRPPQGDYSAPNRQWGGYGVNPEAQPPRSSSPIYDRKSDQFPDNPWGGPPLKSQTTRDYGAPDSPSPKKPNSPNDDEVHKLGWRGSPVMSQTPCEYGVSPDNISARKLVNPKEYGIPDSRWGNPVTPDYRGSSNKWDKSSSPAYDHLQNNPEKRWGGSARKTQIPEDHGVPSKQWERSSSPTYGHLQNNPSSPKNQWGSPMAKTQSRGDYVFPSNQQGRSPGPVYDYTPYSPSKNHNSSSVKNQLGNPPLKTQNPLDYGFPSNPQGSSLSPIYDYPPNSPSSPKNQRGSPPVKTQSPGHYVVPSNQQGSPVYDYPPNTPSKNRWGSSPLKTQSPLSNQWERSSSPVYDHPPKDGHQIPPEVTCKDGVCTINDKPKGPQGTYGYDEPKGNRNNFPITKPVSYPDDQYGSDRGSRSKPYVPDHQPKDDKRSTKQTNLEEGLEQLNLDAGASPKGTALSGPHKFTVPPPGGLGGAPRRYRQ